MRPVLGAVGDIVNFNDGEMLVIDKIIDISNDAYYQLDVKGANKVNVDSEDICSIQHNVSNLDMFDRYYLDAITYLTNARRFIHDNALDGAESNLQALREVTRLMIKTIDIIDPNA